MKDMTFSRAIKAAMVRRGATTRAVSTASGVSLSAVEKWIEGRSWPRAAAAYRVAEALETPRLYDLVVKYRAVSCLSCGAQIINHPGGITRRWCNRSCAVRYKGGSLRESRERMAIIEKCRSCEPAGTCFDGGCPLRYWSPFPLVEDSIIPTAERAA